MRSDQAKLPRHNPKAECVKCRSSLISTLYRDGNAWEDVRRGRCFEYLSRRCEGCHYEWAEKTDDTP